MEHETKIATNRETESKGHKATERVTGSYTEKVAY